jgi:hypothetical protein
MAVDADRAGRIPASGGLGSGHRRPPRRRWREAQAAAALDAELDGYRDSADWGALVLEDPVHRAVVVTVLGHLGTG